MQESEIFNISAKCSYILQNYSLIRHIFTYGVPNDATYRQMQTIHNTNNYNTLQIVQNTANADSTVISNISLDLAAATYYFSTVDRVPQ